VLSGLMAAPALAAFIGILSCSSVPQDELAAKWAAAVAAFPKVPEPFMPPIAAAEWYMVTIANVSVGYMHTTVDANDDFVRTMEVMDVQVSRGTDTSRMAFETVFDELPLQLEAPNSIAEAARTSGGVKVMAYDQRFANSEVKMNASFAPGGVTLTSYNGEKWHSSDL